MSTNINIKKRIDIQEEGVSITPDVNSINFVGSGVTASSTGNDVTVNISGGSGTTTYYLNQTVNQAPYKEFSSIPTVVAEQTIVTSVAAGATVTVQSFQTPSGVPGTTNIPGGLWSFYLHFSGTTTDTWSIFTEVYKRDLGGVETLLLTTDAVPTSTLTGTAVMILTDGVFPASTVLTTDRIVVKVRVTNTDSTTNSITFHTEGSTNYSVGLTTLNQIVPTGAVTSVTGTAPVVSSGGTTPAISIPQANGTTDGYLDSTDWTTFNNKPDNLSQLNDVDIVTTPLGDGEILTYDGVSGLWKNEPPNNTPTNQVVLFADLATTEALKACTYNNGTLGVGATLTGNANGQLSTVSFTDRIDNVVTALGQIILVKNQPITSNPLTNRGFQNGLYIVTQLGSPTQPFIITRTTDSDTQAELYPLQVNVFGGQTQANLAYLQKTIDPIVGTNNIVFTTTVLGIQNTPVLHVDTATSAALPTCTYTSGTNPTLPGQGAFLEADVNGILPAINGVTLTAGRRFLVKDQVNQAHNGTYTVSSVGSASTKWRLIRVDAWGGNFTVLDREWKVNNPSSSKYGARYSTNLLGLANTAIGTTNIVFTELVDINTNIYNTDGTLAGNRTVTMAGNTLNLSGGNVGINTIPTELLDVNGKTKTTTFQLTTTPTAGHVLTSDASGNGTWQANGNGTVTSVELSAGTGISLAGTNPITSSGTITVTNSAPDQTVVLNAGTGIGVTGTYPNFTISNTDPTTGVTLTSAGGSQSLVNDGTGPTLAVKGLSAGGGILLAPSVGNDFITISNVSPASSVTLTSAGGTETLINDGTGPTLATKGVTAGTGISLSSTATDLTVTNAAPDQIVTLTAGTNIGITGTYPNFTIDNTAVTPSGKIGITDSNGVFTYYSTLPAACAAAVSGQTITLFTDVTETTATAAALPDGVDLNLNGYSYILDVAGPTNAIETVGTGSRNNIYNGKIIRRNVGSSSFFSGVCLRNRCSALNMYGVELINDDDCTALLIEESGTVNGSWSARCDGANASGVTVDSGYNPFIYNGTITSQGVGVYVETGSSVNIYDSFIQSGSIAIQSAQGVSVYNSTVLASSNTGIEITSGTLIMDRSFVFASSGGAISISSGTMNISLSRIGSVGANGISLGTITGNIELIGSHITTLNGANNFAIENLQAYKVDISNNYFYIQGTGTRRNLSFANTSDAGNANIDVKNNTLEVVSSGIAGSASNIYFGNYLSGSYKVSGNELKCQSPAAAARCIRTSGFPLTMAYVGNILKITNGQNPIDLNITQGNGFTPDLYGNIQTDY